MSTTKAPTSATDARLENIPVGKVDRNPENPRLFFRQGELDQLLESIRLYGVQVPISVYRDGNRFVLIDGERRWRCSRKLNKPTIPALVQSRPSALENLLLMFNIHSLREQWDLMTVALKLPRVIQLHEKQRGKTPNERDLAETTGLSRATIRRSKLLMELPQEYKDLLLRELNAPKNKQKLTEDFFIEMERALTTIERAMPEAIPDRDSARRALLDKYRGDVITDIVDFRDLARIARAENVEADPAKARSVLRRVLAPNNYSIKSAYSDSVSAAYEERDILTRVQWLAEHLNSITQRDLDDDLRDALRALLSRLRGVLGER
jgi:ParB/RepB/Spo0J family partition protein